MTGWTGPLPKRLAANLEILAIVQVYSESLPV